MAEDECKCQTDENEPIDFTVAQGRVHDFIWPWQKTYPTLADERAEGKK